MGQPYEVYNPIVAIEVAAAKATELPRLGKPRMKLRVQASHTAGPDSVSDDATKLFETGRQTCPDR